MYKQFRCLITTHCKVVERGRPSCIHSWYVILRKGERSATNCSSSFQISHVQNMLKKSAEPGNIVTTNAVRKDVVFLRSW